MYGYLESKVNIRNAASYYELTGLFSLQKLTKKLQNYLELHFTTVAETTGFLDLDFALVKKILSSSSLKITSELEVFNAVDAWVNYKKNERKKHAKDLFFKVRLPLLSDTALNYVLHKTSSFKEIDEMRLINYDVPQIKEMFFQNNSSICLRTRHNIQNMFNILVYGYIDEEIFEYQVDGKNLKKFKVFDSEIEKRFNPDLVYLKGDIYFFGGSDNDNKQMTTIEKYSMTTKNSYKKFDLLDDRYFFCACAFMDNIYILGGVYGSIVSQTNIITRSCLEYNPKQDKWKKISNMNKKKFSAACTHFEGHIVVSGGCGDDPYGYLNTVERYDHVSDSWATFAKMNFEHVRHNMIAMKNKLFVVEGNQDIIEVFDSTCNRFAVLKSKLTFSVDNECVIRSVSNGSKLVFFTTQSEIVACYDVERDEWSEEKCEVIKNLDEFSCFQVPRLEI